MDILKKNIFPLTWSMKYNTKLYIKDVTFAAIAYELPESIQIEAVKFCVRIIPEILRAFWFTRSFHVLRHYRMRY